MLRRFGLLGFSPKRIFFFFFIWCLIPLRNINQPNISLMEGKRHQSWAVVFHPYFRYISPFWARMLGIYLFWCRGSKADIHYNNLLMQRRRKYAKTVALVKKSNAPSAQVLVTFSNCPSTWRGRSICQFVHPFECAYVFVFVCVHAIVHVTTDACWRVGRARTAESERQSRTLGPLRPFWGDL